MKVLGLFADPHFMSMWAIAFTIVWIRARWIQEDPYTLTAEDIPLHVSTQLVCVSALIFLRAIGQFITT